MGRTPQAALYAGEIVQLHPAACLLQENMYNDPLSFCVATSEGTFCLARAAVCAATAQCHVQEKEKIADFLILLV